MQILVTWNCSGLHCPRLTLQIEFLIREDRFPSVTGAVIDDEFSLRNDWNMF
jgi:hypothetical protein